MSIDIIVPGGESRRLLTAGKYCPDDIVVTAQGGGVELPELENPGTAQDLMAGKQLLDGAGQVVEGAFSIDAELAEQAALIAEIQAAVQNKIAGAVPADPREGYQRVEYITTAEEGTYPYIITDFYGDNESGMELVASFPILQDKIPMGSREDSSSATRFYCAYPMSASSIYYGFNTGASISCTMKADTIYRLQTNFLNSRLVNAFDGNGGRKAIASVSGNLTPQSAPVSIFGYNNAATGSINTKREFRLYSARCSQGYEVVREYIPCRRKSDGAVGLYEKFSGTFWGNDDPDGSAFAAGPDIDWEV